MPEALPEFGARFAAGSDVPCPVGDVGVVSPLNVRFAWAFPLAATARRGVGEDRLCPARNSEPPLAIFCMSLDRVGAPLPLLAVAGSAFIAVEVAAELPFMTAEVSAAPADEEAFNFVTFSTFPDVMPSSKSTEEREEPVDRRTFGTGRIKIMSLTQEGKSPCTTYDRPA